eukprot:s5205_g4.t1
MFDIPVAQCMLSRFLVGGFPAGRTDICGDGGNVEVTDDIAWDAGHGNGASEAWLESSEPQLVEEARGVTGAACGPSHSAFVIDGRLYTYGSNRHGKLGRQGDGVLQEPGPVSLQAPDGHQPLPELISLGGNHSAVITEGGVLWTWGYGGSFWYGGGALGLGKRSQVDSPEMVMSFVNHGMEVEQAFGQEPASHPSDSHRSRAQAGPGGDAHAHDDGMGLAMAYAHGSAVGDALGPEASARIATDIMAIAQGVATTQADLEILRNGVADITEERKIRETWDFVQAEVKSEHDLQQLRADDAHNRRVSGHETLNAHFARLNSVHRVRREDLPYERVSCWFDLGSASGNYPQD